MLIAVLLLAAVPVLVADLRIHAGQQEATSDPSAAIHDARVAKRLAPWSSEPYLVLFDAYERENMAEEAQRALRQAISRDSSSWTLWRLLADISRGRERDEALARVSQLNPLQSQA